MCVASDVEVAQTVDGWHEAATENITINPAADNIQVHFAMTHTADGREVDVLLVSTVTDFITTSILIESHIGMYTSADNAPQHHAVLLF